MPDSGNYGFAAGRGSAGDAFAVEDPEILLTAAASGDQNQVRALIRIQCADARHDAALGFDALHVDRGQQQLDHRPAAADDVLHILPGCAGLAGDHTDALGHRRQRTFALGGEKALGVQLFVQSVKGHLGRTGAKGLHIIHVQLERTVPLVNGGVAVGQHQHAVLRLEVKQLGRITEHHAFYAGGLVL